MPEIIWSEPSKIDYWNNIDFLLEKWTEKEAANFINKVDETIAIISSNPKAFKKSSYKDIRLVPIVPQINLLYKIKDKNTIELIRFWNNLQDPKKLKV